MGSTAKLLLITIVLELLCSVCAGKRILMKINLGGDAVDGFEAENAYLNIGNEVPKMNFRGVIRGEGDDLSVFRTQRFARKEDLVLKIPVPDGMYSVTLMFAETWEGAFQKGARVFDVYMGSSPYGIVKIIDQMDPFAAAGPLSPVRKTFHNIATYGGLTVALRPIMQNPQIAGIVIDGHSYQDVLIDDLPTAPTGGKPLDERAISLIKSIGPRGPEDDAEVYDPALNPKIQNEATLNAAVATDTPAASPTSLKAQSAAPKKELQINATIPVAVPEFSMKPSVPSNMDVGPPRKMNGNGQVANGLTIPPLQNARVTSPNAEQTQRQMVPPNHAPGPAPGSLAVQPVQSNRKPNSIMGPSNIPPAKTQPPHYALNAVEGVFSLPIAGPSTQSSRRKLASISNEQDNGEAGSLPVGEMSSPRLTQEDNIVENSTRAYSHPQQKQEVQEPQIATDQANGMIQEPSFAIDQVSHAIQEPPVDVEQANPVLQEPTTVTDQATQIIQEPPITTDQTNRAIQEPPIATDQASQAIQEPPIAADQINPAIQEPPISVDQINAASQEPPIAVDQINPASQEPPVAVHQANEAIQEHPVAADEVLQANQMPTVANGQTSGAIQGPLLASEETNTVSEHAPIVQASSGAFSSITHRDSQAGNVQPQQDTSFHSVPVSGTNFVPHDNPGIYRRTQEQLEGYPKPGLVPAQEERTTIPAPSQSNGEWYSVKEGTSQATRMELDGTIGHVQNGLGNEVHNSGSHFQRDSANRTPEWANGHNSAQEGRQPSRTEDQTTLGNTWDGADRMVDREGVREAQDTVETRQDMWQDGRAIRNTHPRSMYDTHKADQLRASEVHRTLVESAHAGQIGPQPPLPDPPGHGKDANIGAIGNSFQISRESQGGNANYMGPGLHIGDGSLEGMCINNSTHCSCGMRQATEEIEECLFVVNEEVHPMVCTKRLCTPKLVCACNREASDLCVRSPVHSILVPVSVRKHDAIEDPRVVLCKRVNMEEGVMVLSPVG